MRHFRITAVAASVSLIAGCHANHPAMFSQVAPSAGTEAPAPRREVPPAAPAPVDSSARVRARADSARRAADAAAAADAARRAAVASAAAAARAAMIAMVHFDFDRSDLRDSDKATLGAKLAALQINPAVRIRIEGNTDERGSKQYNLALGMRRAAAVKQYLVDRGLDPSRLDVISNGEQQSICTDHAESCWSQNRRDEFVIIAGGDHIVGKS